MAELKLSDVTIEFEDYRLQFNRYLRTQPVWKGELTTQTSQTLVDLISTVATHTSAAILRAREDAYAETAQSEDAIRSITQMQGVRMTRKSPAVIRDCPIESTTPDTLPPYTQFNIGGKPYFIREQLVLDGVNPTLIDMYQGEVKRVVAEGIDTEHQTFISNEDLFTVSDRDTEVHVNGTLIPKALGGLWNYRDSEAYSDTTMADGRLVVTFGNNTFGTIPKKNEAVVITYVVTEGAAGNNANLINKNITTTVSSNIKGVALSNPLGGADEKPFIIYKNIASGSFGTYLSGVTKSQYVSLVSTYPGIMDAITQAQREINPMALPYMNVIRVAALTNTPWDQKMQKEFITYMESVTMYAPRFVWSEAIPVDRDLEIEVYVFNSAVMSKVEARSIQAIKDLFAPQPGLLMTNFYVSDIDTRIMEANRGDVSYVIVKNPIGPMIVKAPNAADVEYEIKSGAGRLTPSVYAYSVAVTTELEAGSPNQWVFPHITGTGTYGVELKWRKVPGATKYRIYGRLSTQGYGLIKEITATPNSPEIMSFLDDGSITPTGGLPNTLNEAPIRYNRLRSLDIKVRIADRQQKLQSLPRRDF